ncbi:hypothetical protein Glove_352g35 [Diversispora epigaea]|uniref:Uncharacterized protein n=1 Tax=Diversispora epigaea TaxID=1348612 RepID=A0A397HC63_9GLOM|nr:hypothetical protein Glove_352g35 [Diversispora epigaea]
MTIANKFELEKLTEILGNHLIETQNFNSLQESALVSLPKRDDLQLEENSTLPGNLKEWNNENFTTLKITLQQ